MTPKQKPTSNSETLILRVSPELLAALDAIVAERGGDQSRSSVAREMIAAGLRGRAKR